MLSPVTTACCWKPWASPLALNIQMSCTSSPIFISSCFLPVKLFIFVLDKCDGLRCQESEMDGLRCREPEMDIPFMTICQFLGSSSSLPASSSATPAMFLQYISSQKLEWKDFDSKILSHLMRCGKNHCHHHQPAKQKKNKTRNHSVLGKLGLENIGRNKKALKASLLLINLTVDTATTLLWQPLGFALRITEMPSFMFYSQSGLPGGQTCGHTNAAVQSGLRGAARIKLNLCSMLTRRNKK